MWILFFGFVTFLTLGCTPVFGNIQVVKRKETSIECSSNSDISFKFYSNFLKKFLTIAECDFHRKSCALLTTIHTHLYTTSYTGRGGILVITDLEEESVGIYQCYETYNRQNSVSTNISTSEYTATTGNNCSVQINTTSLPEGFGHIVLGVLRDKTIECSSNVDITFKFIGNKANASVTIAECELSKKSCKSFHKKYNLSYTGIGGVLHINSLNNESFGTYICCATYNPNIFVSIDMIAHVMDSVSNTYNVTVLAENNTDIQWDKGATNNASNILPIVYVCIWSALAIIWFAIVILQYKRKAFPCGASYDTENAATSSPTACLNATATYPNKEHDNTYTPLLKINGNTSNSDSTHQNTKHDCLDQKHKESRPSVKVVAAIEVGTTYSGYAFSFAHDPNNVIINTNWLYGGSSIEIATKTPTIVLLDNKGDFHSFGFDAEKYYLSLKNHKGWRLFRRFKMALHENCSLDATIDDLEGNPYPAIKLFTTTLRFLNGHLLKALQTKSSTLLETEIHYMITVPAVWTDGARHFMKESAIRAGINKERLELVVDSVAAATWLTGVNIKDNPDINLQTPGSKWLVVKIGGGTANVLAYEVLPKGKVKVIQKASGGAWGFTNVEQQLLENLDKELGVGNLDKLRREHIGDYYELLQEIEDKIRSKYIFSQDVCVVRLPYSLSPEVKHRIQIAKIKTWFDSEISSFVAHIKTALNNNLSLRELTNMVLVDICAESMYVQHMLCDSFTEFKVIIPPDPKLAVLKGAVLYGHSTGSDIYKSE